MTRAEDALAAVRAGADAVGFIFHPGSPRCVSIETAAAIAAQLPPETLRVAVQVGWTPETVRAVELRLRIDLWQLHGAETPAQAAALRPRRLLKVYGMPRTAGEAPPADYDVDGFLLDKASVRHGGTGQTFDWELARAFRSETRLPCILSGGLNPDNVERAVQTVQPWGVDVCSGVEASPGLKDPARMADFIRLCKPLLT